MWSTCGHSDLLGPRVTSVTVCVNAEAEVKAKASSYIAQYPVLRTVQSALY